MKARKPDSAIFDEGWNFAKKGNADNPITVEATAELYESTYGEPHKEYDEDDVNS